jgi:hypothetical protein
MHAALAHVAHVFPGTVRGAPARGRSPGTWNTTDGWIGFRALWAWHAMIPAAQALTRLSMAQAFRIGMGGEEVQQLADSTSEELLPE